MGQACSLLERDDELALSDAALRRVGSGDGAMVIFEGGDGLGKTGLLASVRADAADRGFQVFQARGNVLEQRFRWGVVRQLFERRSGVGPSEVLDGALVGPAVLAGDLFDYTRNPRLEDTASRDDHLYSALHGLYWLCRNLARERPLLLLIDDADCADVESLRFVNYVANRLEGSGILLVLSCGQSGPADTRDLITSASVLPSASHAVLAPLSPEAVRRRIAERLGREPHAGFSAACLATTGGNPLHLEELLKELHRHGLAPVDSTAEQVPLLTPARVARRLLRQLSRLPHEATALATAVAVLGADARPRHCAVVAELGEAEAAAQAAGLRDVGVLGPGLPYSFQRPELGRILFAETPAHIRSAAHGRAAHCLYAARADSTTVAGHLCRAEPGTARWAADVLVSAAQEEMRGGHPEHAVRYLRRALAEPLSAPDRSRLLGALGSAQLRSRDPEALVHLRQALVRSPDAERDLRVRLDMGLALLAVGRSEEAVRVFGQLAEEEPGGTVLTHWSSAASMASRLAGGSGRRSRGARAGRGPLPAAHAAFEAMARGLPVNRVRRLASAAGRTFRLPTHDTEITDASVAAWTLAQCDRPDLADRILSDLVVQASEAGWLLAGATAAALRAGVLLDAGRTAEAEALARGVLGDHDARRLTTMGVPLAAAALVHCLVDTQRPEEARELLARFDLADRLPEAAHFVPLRLARARLRIRLGEHEAGLAEMCACREQVRRQGWRYPAAVCAVLPDAVHAVALTADPGTARRIAREEVEHARAFGAARPLAVALRTYGERLGGAEGLRRLEEAHHILEPLPYLPDRGRTLLALGSVLRRDGNRSAARKQLQHALELARTSGASALENAARAELRLAGDRLAGGTLRSPASLTPAEERVARKAAEGMSNREISQALFVTVKTVEWHLSQAYAKLGISRRAELPRVLADRGLRVGERTPA
ncbi:tetratricopeptide repeat protein [Streptomyces chumphonensis]|uniref:Tetratricopeptide repeat protein n=1 Tax=Streptomyces chumphonensis TaxID=1214925 RepID=A0A927I9U3_9ACTN|nr:LuxR C-terminal-related transcriptional regulator [Streptomyces chumphonensis]MBD3929998.1 tetratricopeptide repeat protein [Streptomyces chumphonensis]